MVIEDDWPSSKWSHTPRCRPRMVIVGVVVEGRGGDRVGVRRREGGKQERGYSRAVVRVKSRLLVS